MILYRVISFMLALLLGLGGLFLQTPAGYDLMDWVLKKSDIVIPDFRLQNHTPEDQFEMEYQFEIMKEEIIHWAPLRTDVLSLQILAFLIENYAWIIMILWGLVFVNSMILAAVLNRSSCGWGIGGILAPYLFGLILPFLYKAEPSTETSCSTTGGWSPSTSVYGGGSTLTDKQCSNCGRSVSLAAQAGQSCPHCGAYWGSERQIYR